MVAGMCGLHWEETRPQSILRHQGAFPSKVLSKARVRTLKSNYTSTIQCSRLNQASLKGVYVKIEYANSQLTVSRRPKTGTPKVRNNAKETWLVPRSRKLGLALNWKRPSLWQSPQNMHLIYGGPKTYITTTTTTIFWVFVTLNNSQKLSTYTLKGCKFRRLVFRADIFFPVPCREFWRKDFRFPSRQYQDSTWKVIWDHAEAFFWRNPLVDQEMWL